MVTWNEGAKCGNCNRCGYRFIEEVKIGKKRFMHFYCVYCSTERLKYCDFGNIKEFLKTQY